MKLFKWETNIKPAFPNIVEKFFGKRFSGGSANGEEVATLPSINISDANKAFEVNVALPGLNKTEVNIEIEDNCLVISSEKDYTKEDNSTNWIRKEYGYASFKRMFELPESADPDKVLAEMKNGVLSIKIAKKAGYESRIKQIKVE